MNPAQKTVVEVKAEVLQAVRQHARSTMNAEVCGVWLGTMDGGVTRVEARIAGDGAAQGGAHVTFTHDTWEHIYREKDQKFPGLAIVGWYHSHPGFSVFLSEYDLFIHKNFFSNLGQVAWVYDPHSDEEGCFVWSEGEIVRVPSILLKDGRAGMTGTEGRKSDGNWPRKPNKPGTLELPHERAGWLFRAGMIGLGAFVVFMVGLFSGLYFPERLSRLRDMPNKTFSQSEASVNDESKLVRAPTTNVTGAASKVTTRVTTSRTNASVVRGESGSNAQGQPATARKKP
jgi:proteasome lid subunit RPN8/RPN11